MSPSSRALACNTVTTLMADKYRSYSRGVAPRPLRRAQVLEPDPRDREAEELRDEEERRQLRLIKDVAAGVVWHF